MPDDGDLIPSDERALIQCVFCDKTFPTLAAERRHINEEHAEESALHCPACKESGFQLPSALMGHIERGKCRVLKLDELNRRRERVTAFRRQLATQGPVRNDFSRMINKRAMFTSDHPGPTEMVSRQSSTVPSISGENAARYPAMSPAPSESALTVRSDGTANSNAALAYNNQPNYLKRRADQEPEYTNRYLDTMDRGRYADLSAYRSEYSGKYHCSLCPKTFKSDGGLRAHLRSPAHSDVRHTCPECHKSLHCLEGMTAHAEDPRSRCGISRKDKFAEYMEQLTGGLVDVIFVGENDRVRYETSLKAEEEFEKAREAEGDGYIDYQNNVW